MYTKPAFVFIFLCLVLPGVHAQTLVHHPADHTFGYIKEARARGTKDQLFEKAKAFLIQTYNSTQQIAAQSNKESGELMAKGAFLTSIHTAGKTVDAGAVVYQLRIHVKDNGYLVTLNQLEHISSGQHGSGGKLENEDPDAGKKQMSKKQWEQIKQQAEEKATQLLYALHRAMARQTPADF